MSLTVLPKLDKAWWKEATVYQIYPSSFKDSNNDGRGDLNGITEKLDYIHDLGVDVIWLCPIYTSPGVDEGYDISNYRDIDPRFGTLEDWERLVKGLHNRGMKLIMDLVVNHSSEEHPWFQESKSSRTNPKADWYMWHDGKKDENGQPIPPNNWRSLFGGSAWQWYQSRQQWVLHIFAKEQPDLNWHCPELRQEVYADMKFWLDKGIDGFRLDAITHISKLDGFPDAPVTEPNEKYQSAFDCFNNGPKVHDWLKEMYSSVLSKYDIMTVGEASVVTPELAISYVDQDRNPKELDMLFSGEHVDLYGGFETDGKDTPRDVAKFKEIMYKWQTGLMKHGGWNSLFCENHDHPRSIIRYGDERPEFRGLSSRALAMLLFSLCGTPYIYQGQELGMINVPEDWPIENYADLVSQRHYAEQKEKGTDLKNVMRGLRRKARDNARTPMPWDDSESAGFSTAEPWMKVNPDNKICNVAQQSRDDKSVLAFWKSVIKLRKEHPELVYGSLERLEFKGCEDKVFTYKRSLDGKTAFVVISFSTEPVEFDIDFRVGPALIESTNNSTGIITGNKVKLGGFEGGIYVVSE